MEAMERILAEKALVRWLVFFSLFLIILLTFSGTPLRAYGPRAVVIPFRVTGEPPVSFYDKSELPSMMQEATHFLFEYNLEYGLQDLNETRRALRHPTLLKMETRENLTLDKAERICIETDASFLIMGSAHLSRSGSTQVGIQSYSCKGGRVIASGESSGDINSLQLILQKALFRATPYASRRVESDITSRRADPIEVGVILDSSGSMVYNLDPIRKGLKTTLSLLPRGSRLGSVILTNNKIRTESFSSDLKMALSGLESVSASGENDVNSLLLACNEFLRHRSSFQKKRLLIFYDGSLGRGRALVLEERIRKLKNEGYQISLFPLPSMKRKDLMEWKRISRVLGSPMPRLVSGRRVGFLQGFSIFMVQSDLSMYRADDDVTGAILQDSLNVERLTPIPLIHYTSSDLSLDTLPAAYAEVNHLKITGTGSIVTNLEKSVDQVLRKDALMEDGRYRVLLKNHGRSFWIGVNGYREYKYLKENPGRSIYVGLSFRTSEKGELHLINNPDRVVVREQQHTPRLFINTLENLKKTPDAMIRPGDLWFLLVTVLDVKDVERNREIRIQ